MDAAQSSECRDRRPRRRWRLSDRLGAQAIRAIVTDRRAGATQRELAERYATSLSSVKRLLQRANH
jgi:DNA-binding transcriptional regulator LsrR (DeoR family)